MPAQFARLARFLWLLSLAKLFINVLRAKDAQGGERERESQSALSRSIISGNFARIFTRSQREIVRAD